MDPRSEIGLRGFTNHVAKGAVIALRQRVARCTQLVWTHAPCFHGIQVPMALTMLLGVPCLGCSAHHREHRAQQPHHEDVKKARVDAVGSLRSNFVHPTQKKSGVLNERHPLFEKENHCLCTPCGLQPVTAFAFSPQSEEIYAIKMQFKGIFSAVHHLGPRNLNNEHGEPLSLTVDKLLS